MHVLAILLLALGISMDSFAVSLSNSIALHRTAPARLLWIPVIFAIAQSTLASLGFILGSFVGEILETFEGPITFAILVLIGAEMIYSGTKAQHNQTAVLEGSGGGDRAVRITVIAVLIEALATSLDAFAIGFMLRASNTNPVLACIIIALITFIVSAIGIVIGKRAGMILGEKAQLFGGIVLIVVGALSLVL